ncbi:MAG: LapA family protein [bacterium]|jgi:uncharacterized integral membrane protein
MLITLLVAVFSIQNKDSISITFLSWVFRAPAVLLVLGSFTLGALLTGLLGTFRQIGLGRDIRGYQNKIRQLEKELQEIKVPTGTAGRETDGKPKQNDETATL